MGIAPDAKVPGADAGIGSDCVDGAGPEGFLPNAFDVFALAEVRGEGDHVQSVAFADPRDHDAGVEAAGVR